MSLTIGLSLASVRLVLGLVGVGYSLLKADFGQNASFSNELLKNVTGGAVSNFTYDLLKGGGASALAEMGKRLQEGDSKHLNHDLQRAARKAQLSATLLAVRACLEETKRQNRGQRSFWAKVSGVVLKDADEKWLGQVAALWQKKIKELSDRQLPHEIVGTDELMRLFDPEQFDQQLNASSAAAHEQLIATLKDDALAEIRGERYSMFPLPEAADKMLEEAIKEGWNEFEPDTKEFISLGLSRSLPPPEPQAALTKPHKQFKWFSLLCGFFNEEYKQNEHVKAAMLKYLLLDIRDRQGNIILDREGERVAPSILFGHLERLSDSFTQLQSLLQSIEGKQDTILNFVQNFLQENERLHALTRQSVREDGDQTRLIVEDGFDEVERRLEDESAKIQKVVNDGFQRLVKLSTSETRSVELSPEAHRQQDLTWTSLEALGVADASDEEIGLSLIKACNRAAKALFQRKVRNLETVAVPHLWHGIWRETDFEAQKHYLRLADEEGVNVDFRVQQLLADGMEQRRPCKAWIVGPAGVGKTTVLYRSYFELIGAVEEENTTRRHVPVPMLVQPRNLKAEQVHRLDQQHDTDEFLRMILEVWLENRRISVPPQRRTTVLSSLEHHLKLGNIAILIDGFDELNRMDFQTAVFENFFETVEHFVCASRPETDIHQATHKVIKLAPFWEYQTIESYLSNRLPKSYQPAVKPFLSHLSQHDKAEWLRNPRNLNIILGLVKLTDTPSDPEKVLTSALEKGEYRMLEEMFKSSHSRLRRLSELDLKVEDYPNLSAQIWRCFEEIAEEQLNSGAFIIKKSEQTEVWHLVQRARELLDVLNNGESVELRLLNFNLVDFFLTKKLAGQIRGHSPLTFCHLWSINQLVYVSEELRTGATQPRDLIKHVWNKLDDFRLPALDETQGHRSFLHLAPRRFGAVNLVQLALQLEKDIQRSEHARAGTAKPPVEVRGKRLHNLYLDGVDLCHVRFEDCKFDGSSLANANMEMGVFRNCDFYRVNFQCANAHFAAFHYCRFDFDDDQYAAWHQAHRSAVDEMMVQGLKLRNCDGYDLEAFDEWGAKKFKTRYVGKFWDIFNNKQETLVGEGVQEAEDDYYMPAIKDYLSSLPAEQPVYLIDLMAGGSNARLRELLPNPKTHGRKNTTRFNNLKVLAIDRDTSHLVEVRNLLGGDRFAVDKKDIKGRANLADALSKNFDGQPSQADIIIGKKALHELRAPLQRELLAECSETLKPGGRLILFTDSPVSMSSAGYERLQQYVELLRAPGVGVAELRRRLIEELRLGGGNDDCAIFSNLWVAFKDWANHNEHELKNRYFSSITEIQEWGEAVGLRVVRPPQQAKYILVARLFNELGINEAGRYLDQNDDKIRLEDEHRLIDYLKGSEEYQLFCEFAEAHLWDAKMNRPSELGAALGASRKPVEFGKMHEGLSELSLTYSNGVAFEFSVHVIVFEKPLETLK